jgi:monoamine oxidase
VRTVVVGAGAAGLAAAQRLHAHGAEVIVLEARDRIGGRVWTLRPPSLTVPLELGAEFLHGETAEVDDLVREAGLRVMDVAGRRWMSVRGRLRLMDDFWERLDRVMRRLDDKRDPDGSFADALSRMRRVASADRRLATEYVEGFHAADTRLISERSLAEGGAPGDDVRERRISRIVEGYDGVIGALAASVLDRVRFGAVARVIRWRSGRVEVESCDHDGQELPTIQARSVIVAVPLGVLRAPPGATGAIRFDPSIDAKLRVAMKLEMGSVVRVALQMDEPFWIDRRFAKHIGDERLDTLSFLHSSGQVAFPVWWTPYPVRAPLLIGWRGGPQALSLSGMTRDAMLAAAIGSFATLLGISNRRVRQHVRGAYLHDWNSDPFARGAYSYAGVDGSDASASLARPLRQTLFFAGEHADREGRNGTVHGAIASGWRAAESELDAH